MNHHQRLDRVSVALRGAEPAIVVEFRGEPNRALSTRTEMRWGRRGSFSLQLVGPKAGQWFDHELGRGGDIIALIKLERDCNFVEAWQWAQRFIPGSTPRNVPTLRLVQAERGDNHADELKELKLEWALDIWSEVQSLRGTLAEQYLRSRGIEVPDEVLDALAFHPACLWGSATAPALVALIRDTITDEPVGIHRTALTAGGHKIGRKALGLKSGGAIKLSPVVTTELAIGEGIETTLSAIQLGFDPAWAVIDADGLKKFPVLHSVNRLTLLIDNDASGTSQNAAAECRERWLDAGRRVRRVMPPTVGQDINDVLRERGAR
jgi:putative DNA primase/helicase